MSSGEADRRRHQLGANRLAEAAPEPTWRRLFTQFTEPVVLLLIVAAVVSGALGAWADAAAILAIVLVNGVIGFVQEERAERALAALARLTAPRVRVLRIGGLTSIPAEDLVPGDVLDLDAGDAIAADARLFAAAGLRVQEAALTGESQPVDKRADAQLAPETPLAERVTVVHAGTTVTGGHARAIVVATGMHTELGRIAGMIQRQPQEPTPLQKRLAGLGRHLLAGCLAIVAVIFALEMVRGGRWLEVLLSSVSLAVAAVPEGLPTIVTLTLALGLQRMARRRALVRKLPSVETLGCVTVICSDKTGTLTHNEMTVREVTAGGVRYTVSGDGYAPCGDVVACDPAPASSEGARDDLRRALWIGAICNHAQLEPASGQRSWRVVGDPTEGALVVAALKAGISADHTAGGVLAEIPFDPERKSMSVLARGPGGCPMTCTKGAPETVLARCATERWRGAERPLTDERREAILAECDAAASRALRVLALAYAGHAEGAASPCESGLVFAGLAAMMDPPRRDAIAAVARCQSAGIRPVMITGDHPATALAVARELGIATSSDAVMTGTDLDALPPGQLARAVACTPVFARVSPEHKLRVVRSLQGTGQVVAMTGDGVNDGPALRAADIGIAMGRSGTEVAREAAAMVLTDDDFASIVAAVEEGRGIFDNIQRCVHYLLSCNFGEVLFMFAAALIGWPLPLAAVQLLWINLVTDGLPALALAMEPPEPDVMTRPARPPGEPILTGERVYALLGSGVLLALATLTAFVLVYAGHSSNLSHARTVAFCVMSYGQLALAFTCRSRTRTLPQLGLFSNPYLLAGIAASALLQLAVVLVGPVHDVFQTTGHDAFEWMLVVVGALAPATIVETGKLLAQVRSSTPPEIPPAAASVEVAS